MYLYGIGVEPSRQGQGIGSALLQPVLIQANEEHLICYLDTTNEKNLSFYERNDFIVVARAQLSLESPPVWAMVKLP